MGVEEIYSCDECGKKVWFQNCATIVVLAFQGYNWSPSKFDLDRWKEKYWKHKEVYNKQLCPDCIGEAITINCGDDPEFSLREKAMGFLRKHGFVKTAKAMK